MDTFWPSHSPKMTRFNDIWSIQMIKIWNFLNSRMIKSFYPHSGWPGAEPEVSHLLNQWYLLVNSAWNTRFDILRCFFLCKKKSSDFLWQWCKSLSASVSEVHWFNWFQVLHQIYWKISHTDGKHVTLQHSRSCFVSCWVRRSVKTLYKAHL